MITDMFKPLYGLNQRVPSGGSIIAGAVVALLLAGCSGGTTEPSPSGVVDLQLLETATSGGASEEQIAVLQSGAVAFPDYQAAVSRTVGCLRDAGIEVTGDEVSQARGFPEISYSCAASSAGRTNDQTIAIADECIATHSMYIEQAYQLSPGSVEQQEAAFESFRGAIVSCIQDNGGTIAGDATMGEILSASATIEVASGVSCTANAGFTG